jgi:hypothetical protein
MGTLQPDFVNPSNLTIAFSPYVTTAFAGERSLIAHTTLPSLANRIEVYTQADGTVGLGFGSSHTTNLDAAGGPLSLNTLYRLVLRLKPGNLYDVHLNGNLKAAGTYTGLQTFAPSLQMGGGHLGSVDTVIVENRAWSDSEIADDCAIYVPGCAITTPTFDPFVLASGAIGDDLNAAQNTKLTGVLVANNLTFEAGTIQKEGGAERYSNGSTGHLVWGASTGGRPRPASAR